MSNSVEAISVKYLTTKKLSGGTRKEYKSTFTKWTAWGNGVDVDQINRSHFAISWIGFTNKLLRTAAPILVEPRTKRERISARSCIETKQLRTLLVVLLLTEAAFSRVSASG